MQILCHKQQIGGMKYIRMLRDLTKAHRNHNQSPRTYLPIYTLQAGVEPTILVFEQSNSVGLHIQNR
jgi:hypothetical protein